MKHYTPAGNKVQKAIFSFKVKFKVTGSLTLVSFKRVSLVEYACQIWSLYLLRFESYSEGLSWQQRDKQTGQKQYDPNHSIRGHKNVVFYKAWKIRLRVSPHPNYLIFFSPTLNFFLPLKSILHKLIDFDLH